MRTATITLALVLAACGGGSGSSSQPVSGLDDDPSAPADGASRAEPTEAEVLADYVAAKEALYAAFHPPDPDFPGLLASWEGEALSRAQDTLRQLESGGISWISTVETAGTLVSLVGDRAVVEDCVVDRVQVVDTATEEPIGDPVESVTHIESHLELIDGTWEIVEERELSEPCTPT